MGMHESIKALSDKTRREILSLLKRGDLTAGEIANQFSMTQATISHHLTILREAGLIDDRRAGKFIYYSLNTPVIEEIMHWFIDLKGDNTNEKK